MQIRATTVHPIPFRPGRAALASALILALLVPFPLWAQESPTNGQITFGQVNGGTAAINAAGAVVDPLSIQVNQNGSVISWDSFNIDATTVDFNFDTTGHRVLNLDTQGSASLLNGVLDAGNGNVFLANPSGITVGSSGVIQGMGFFGIAGEIDGSDFFNNVASNEVDIFGVDGNVLVNAGGQINSDVAVLVGNQVQNLGTISSANQVILAAVGGGGSSGSPTVKLMGLDGAVTIAFQGGDVAGSGADPTTDAGVIPGRVDASGADVVLAASDLYALAVQQSEQIDAGSLVYGASGGMANTVELSGTTNVGGAFQSTVDITQLDGADLEVGAPLLFGAFLGNGVEVLGNSGNPSTLTTTDAGGLNTGFAAIDLVSGDLTLSAVNGPISMPGVIVDTGNDNTFEATGTAITGTRIGRSGGAPDVTQHLGAVDLEATAAQVGIAQDVFAKSVDITAMGNVSVPRLLAGQGGARVTAGASGGDGSITHQILDGRVIDRLVPGGAPLQLDASGATAGEVAVGQLGLRNQRPIQITAENDVVIDGESDALGTGIGFDFPGLIPNFNRGLSGDLAITSENGSVTFNQPVDAPPPGGIGLGNLDVEAETMIIASAGIGQNVPLASATLDAPTIPDMASADTLTLETDDLAGTYVAGVNDLTVRNSTAGGAGTIALGSGGVSLTAATANVIVEDPVDDAGNDDSLVASAVTGEIETQAPIGAGDPIGMVDFTAQTIDVQNGVAAQNGIDLTLTASDLSGSFTTNSGDIDVDHMTGGDIQVVGDLDLIANTDGASNVNFLDDIDDDGDGGTPSNVVVRAGNDITAAGNLGTPDLFDSLTLEAGNALPDLPFTADGNLSLGGNIPTQEHTSANGNVIISAPSVVADGTTTFTANNGDVIVNATLDGDGATGGTDEDVVVNAGTNFSVNEDVGSIDPINDLTVTTENFLVASGKSVTGDGTADITLTGSNISGTLTQQNITVAGASTVVGDVDWTANGTATAQGGVIQMGAIDADVAGSHELKLTATNDIDTGPIGAATPLGNVDLTADSNDATEATPGTDGDLTPDSVVAANEVRLRASPAQTGSGAVDTGDVTSQTDDVEITAGGSVTAGIVAAGDDLDVDAGTSVSAFAVVAGINGGADADDDGMGNDVTVTAGTSASVTIAEAIDDITLAANAGNLEVLGYVAAGADGVDDPDGNGDDATLTAVDGDVISGPVDAGNTADDDAVVTATGAGAGDGNIDLTGVNVTAGEDVTLTADKDITVGDLQAGDDVTATAGRNLTAVDVNAGDSATLQGGANNTTPTDGEVDGNNATLTAGADAAAGGALQVTQVTADEDATLTAAGGAVNARGDVTILGGSPGVTAGADATDDPDGLGDDVVVTATEGDVIASGDIRAGLTADDDATVTATGTSGAGTGDVDSATANVTAGEDVTITADVAVDVANVGAGDDVDVDAGTSVTAGTVVAGDQAELDFEQAGDQVNTAPTDGEVDGNNVDVLAMAGNVDVAGAKADEDVTLNAQGATSDVVIGASGVFAGVDDTDDPDGLGDSILITAGRDVISPAGGQIGAGISVDDAAPDSDGAAIFADRDVVLPDSDVTAGADVSVTATTGSITLRDAQAGDDVFISAATSATARNVVAGNQAMLWQMPDKNTPPDMTTTDVSGLDSDGSGNDVLVVAQAGNVDVEVAKADEDVTLDAQGATSDVVIGAGGVFAGVDDTDDPDAAGDDVSISAGRDVIQSAGAVQIGAGTSEDDGGTLDDDDAVVTAARNVNLPGSDVTAGEDVRVEAVGGTVTLQDAQAGDDVIVVGDQGVTVRNLIAGNQAMLWTMPDKNNPPTMTTTDITALDLEGDGNDVLATAASNDLAFEMAKADEDVTLNANSATSDVVIGAGGVFAGVDDTDDPDATGDDVTIFGGRDVIQSAGAVQIGAGTSEDDSGTLDDDDAMVTAARDVTLPGSDITAGEDVNITASTGTVTLQDAQAGDDVLVFAGQAVTMRNLIAGNQAMLWQMPDKTTPPDMTTTDITAFDLEGNGNDVSVTAGNGNLAFEMAKADEDVSLSATTSDVVIGAGGVFAGVDDTDDPDGTGDDVAIFAGQDVIQSAGAVQIGAGTSEDDGGTLDDDDAMVTATRDVNLPGSDITAGEDVVVNANTGSVTLQDAQAGDDVIVVGDQGVTVRNLVAGNQAMLWTMPDKNNPPTMTTTDITALDLEGDGNDVLATAASNNLAFEMAKADEDVTLNANSATSDVVIGAGGVFAGVDDTDDPDATGDDVAIFAGQDVIQSAGAVQIGAGTSEDDGGTLDDDDAMVTATRDVNLPGSDITAGEDVNITASTGTVTLQDAQAGDDVLVFAGQAVTMRNLIAGNQAMLWQMPDKTTPPDMTTTDITAFDLEGNGNDVSVTAGNGNLAFEMAKADEDVSLSATTSDVVIGAGGVFAGVDDTDDPDGAGDDVAIFAGQDVIQSAGAVQIGAGTSEDDGGTLDDDDAMVTATRDVNLPGSDITAGEDVVVNANTGSVTLQDAQAGDDVSVFGETGVTVRNLVAGNQAMLWTMPDKNNPPTMTTTDITAFDLEGNGNNVVATANNGNLAFEMAKADEDVTLDANSATSDVVIGAGGVFAGVDDTDDPDGAGDDVSIFAGRDVVSAGGAAIQIGAGTSEDDSGTLDEDDAVVTATRDVNLPGSDITAGEDVVVNANTGSVTLQDAQAGDDVSVFGETGVTVRNLVAGNQAMLWTMPDKNNPPTMTTTDITALDAEGNGNNVVATANNGNLAFEMAKADEDVTLNANSATSDVVIGAGGVFAGVDDTDDPDGAGDDVSIFAGRDVVSAGGAAIQIGAGTSEDDSGTLDEDDAVVTATRDVNLPGSDITAGEDVVVNANTGSVTLQDAQAGDDVSVFGETGVTVRNLVAGNQAMLWTMPDKNNPPTMTTTDITALDAEGNGNNVVATANNGNLAFEMAKADEDVTLNANSATSDVVIGAGGVFAGVDDTDDPDGAGDDVVIFAGQDVTSPAGGQIGAGISVDDAAADDDDAIVLGNRNVNLPDSDVTAGADVSVQATNGFVSLRDAQAGDDVIVQAGTSVTARNLVAGNQAMLWQMPDKNTPPDMTTTNVSGLDAGSDGNNVAVDAGLDPAQGGQIDVSGNVVADEDVILQARGDVPGGAMQNGQVQAGDVNTAGTIMAGIDAMDDPGGGGDDVTINAFDGSFNPQGDVSTGLNPADPNRVDDDVFVNATGTGGNGFINAPGVAFSAGQPPPTDGGDAILMASANIVTGNVMAGQEVNVNAGGAASLGNVTSGENTVITVGSNAQTGNINAGRDLLAMGPGRFGTGVDTVGRDALLMDFSTLAIPQLTAGRDIFFPMNGTSGVFFQGGGIFGAGQTIVMQSGAGGPTNRATYFGNDTLDLTAGTSILMGLNDKLSAPEILLDAPAIDSGDLNANNLEIRGGTLNMLGRATGPSRDVGGSPIDPDFGTDIVTDTFFLDVGTVLFNGGAIAPDDVRVGTSDGSIQGPGAALFPDRIQLGTMVPTGGLSSGLDFAAEGVIGGGLVDQAERTTEFIVPPIPTVPTKGSFPEAEELLDALDGCDFGQGGGTSVECEEIYEQLTEVLGGEEPLLVANALYQDLFKSEERTRLASETLKEALDDFLDQSDGKPAVGTRARVADGSVNGRQFRAFLERNPEYAAGTEYLDDAGFMLEQLELMGLSEERQATYQELRVRLLDRLVGELGLEGISIDEFGQAVEASVEGLTPDQARARVERLRRDGLLTAGARWRGLDRFFLGAGGGR